jgi:hypothetical protein
MTMHLARGLYDHNTSKKQPKQLTTNQKAAMEPQWRERNKFLKRQGLPILTFDEFVNYVQGKNVSKSTKNNPKLHTKLTTDVTETKYTEVFNTKISNVSPDACTVKRSILDKRDLALEKPEVRAAILAKSYRVMPLFNKGGYQFVTDGEDVTTLGSRSRR